MYTSTFSEQPQTIKSSLMIKDLTTDQRWTTLCTYACVLEKRKEKYCSSRSFYCDKISKKKLKLRVIQFSCFKSNIMKYIYPVIIKKVLRI